MSKQTITEGLGLEESSFETIKGTVNSKLGENDTISDALEAIGEIVRDNEFGDSNFGLSNYEKKLLLSGFVAGSMATEAKANEAIEKLKMAMTLMAMSKQIGKDPKGNPIFGGAIDTSGMPPEFVELLKRMSEGNNEDEE